MFVMHNNTSRGMTLVEIIVSVGIITVVGMGVAAIQRNIIVNTTILQNTFVTQQKVQRALTKFVKEMRGATQSAGGAYAIEAASTSSITFFANVDADTSIERVRYYVASSTLYRGLTEPTGTIYNMANEGAYALVHNIQNSSTTPIFEYYTKDYDGTSTSTALTSPINIPDVRLVKIMLPVEPSVARSSSFQTYSTQVSVRNLKDNL